MSKMFRATEKKTLNARRRRAKKTRRQIQNQAREVLDESAKIIRLCVHRSAQHIYIQAIDDLKGETVAASSTLEETFRTQKFSSKVAAAEAVGKKLGERLKAFSFSKFVFDRSGYPYQGRVQSVADGIRSMGIVF